MSHVFFFQLFTSQSKYRSHKCKCWCAFCLGIRRPLFSLAHSIACRCINLLTKSRYSWWRFGILCFANVYVKQSAREGWLEGELEEFVIHLKLRDIKNFMIMIFYACCHIGQTHLILLEFRSANLGFTRSSPKVIYNRTIQNTAALRTIDWPSSVLCLGAKWNEILICLSLSEWAIDDFRFTFAIFGMTQSRWTSLIWSPCAETNSVSNLMAHKFVENSPVAITGFRMLIDASTGSTAAIFFRISSILAATWNDIQLEEQMISYQLSNDIAIRKNIELTSLCDL